MPRVIRVGVENSEGNGEFCLDLDLSSLCAGSNALRWWRRGESNPRPKTLYSGVLRAFPVFSFSSPGAPAGRVPVGPSRLGFRPSSPREGDWGYPVRATPFRLHGQSAGGRTRLVRPRKRSYSRWRLWVPAFNGVRGASARHPGASTSPSKPHRPRTFEI